MAKKKTSPNDDSQEEDVVVLDDQPDVMDGEGDDSAQSGSGNYHIGVIQVDLGEAEDGATRSEDEEGENVNVDEYEEIDETPAKASRKLLSSMEEDTEDQNNTETFLDGVKFDPDEAWPYDE